MNKNILNMATISICVFVVSGLIWLLCNIWIYPEKTYNMTEYITDENLHDFTLQDGIITSTSWDPWITLPFDDNPCVKTVDIEIKDLSEENVSATVFSVGYDWSHESVILQKGNNLFNFRPAWDSLQYLRLDLAEKPEVSLEIGSVVINDHSTILKIAVKEAFVFSTGMLLFCLVLLFSCTHMWKNICIKAKTNIASLINRQRISRQEITGFWRLVLKIWIVYVIAILAVLKADFLYIDDLGRNYNGLVSDWNTYSRYIAEFACKLMSADSIVTDTSPLNQIITMLFMAIGAAIVIKFMVPGKGKENLLVIASVPFAISPYFMENISYKIECVIHGVTVLFSTMPLLLCRKRNWQYVLLTTFCIVCMCTTYQGGTGIFPIIIIMLVALEWNRGEKLDVIWKLIWTSVLGYGAGLMCFRIFIMKQVSGHVSSDILPIGQLIPGYFKNILYYYERVIIDFKPFWIIAILFAIGCFIAIYTLKSVHQKFRSFVVACMVVCLMAIMVHGIYPLLQQCIYVPRCMYALGITISLFCIYIIGNGGYLSRIACGILCWCFITFSYTYGNCLVLQQEYTLIKVQAVVSYLNGNYESNKGYNLELQNYIGLAPAITNKTENCKLLGRLIPQTLGGGWMWAEYKLYQYYGIPSNFTTVWAQDKGHENVPSAQNLPLKDSTIWFDVFGDDDNILISFK